MRFPFSPGATGKRQQDAAMTCCPLRGQQEGIRRERNNRPVARCPLPQRKARAKDEYRISYLGYPLPMLSAKLLTRSAPFATPVIVFACQLDGRVSQTPGVWVVFLRCHSFKAAPQATYLFCNTFRGYESRAKLLHPLHASPRATYKRFLGVHRV